MSRAILNCFVIESKVMSLSMSTHTNVHTHTYTFRYTTKAVINKDNIVPK